MEIRPRRPDDLPGCVRMLAEVHESDGYPNRWPDDPAEWLAPENSVAAWVAEHDGRLVGHLVLTGRNDELWVSRLFVDPSARGSKVGEALLRQARSCGVLMLDVVESSERAIALYERTGWTLVGRRDAEWIMSDGTRPIERTYTLN
ncbi:MAG: GNAT family N-acetyltransferase [Rhodococcus sp. (in: high G+C Gram-positive bacteria)]|uniref:GNAT family N-acetyltransferase n=1 Tax=Rhodococcus sp. EPR-157 TaxID=1813677 RepID=UPI000837DCE0|nr:GNAT family N-acetyltransferase [Rhodococcus sp. EPR-157]